MGCSTVRNILLMTFATFGWVLFFAFGPANDIQNSGKVHAQSYGSCPHSSGSGTDLGQVHVQTEWVNLSNSTRGRARNSNVNLRIVNDSGSTTTQRWNGITRDGTRNTGFNGRASFCYLQCFYVQNNQYNHNYRVTGQGRPSNVPSDAIGSWTVRQARFRNDREYHITIEYRFHLPVTVRSNMIRGGYDGGGGGAMTGNFSANHRISQSGSGQTSSSTDTSRTFNSTTANRNAIRVTAPFRVYDSNDWEWRRQGSSRCYNTSGTCRTAGVQTTLSERNFSPNGIANNGGTVRTYWFYRLHELFWNYEHSSFTVSGSTTSSSPGPAHRHRQGSAVAIGSQLENDGDGGGMSARHLIQVRISNGGWQNAPNPAGNRSSWTQSAISANSNGTLRSYNYTIPNNLDNGTTICFRAGVSPFRGRSVPTPENATGHPDGNGARWRYSQPRCIQAYTPPPTFNLSADCTSITVSNLDMRGRTMTNVRVTVGGTTLSGTSTFTGRSRTFTYPRFGQTHNSENVQVTITNDLGGNDTSSNRSDSAGPCYIGTCNINGFLSPPTATITDPTNDTEIEVDRGNNEIFVEGGASSNRYSASVRYRNTSGSGGLAWANNRVRAVFDVNHGSAPSFPRILSISNIGTALDTSIQTGFRAGATLQQHEVSIQLEYENASGEWVEFGDDCSGRFDPFTDFALVPSAAPGYLLPSRENPNRYEFEWSTNLEFNPTVEAVPSSLTINGNARRTMSATGGATIDPTSFTPVSVFPASPDPDVGSVSDFQLGSDFCATLSLNNTAGWANSAGFIPPWSLVGGDSSGELCQSVQDWPYVSIFGGDVVAAGDFGDECSPDAAEGGLVEAYFDASLRDDGSPWNRGSGVQFAALAFDTIDGFASAKIRAPGIEFQNKTSFANTSGGYGGDYPGVHCIPDYWSGRPSEENADNAPNFTAALTGSGAYLFDSGVLVPESENPINDGRDITIYVDGDFYIPRNIEFQNDSWSSIDDIPSFFLIVNGDIYIGHDVGRLDGVYVAQGGTIYTCATDVGSPVVPNQMASLCNQDLEVNGSLIANSVIFNRYGGSSLRYASQDEFVYGEDRRCAESSANNREDRPVCAAEVINFSPELYLTTPNMPVERGPGRGVYDSITSLPPIF